MKKRIRSISLLALFSLTLSSCSEVPFKTEDFTSRIFFNLWDFLAVFLAFIILVVVGFFFAYKPVKAYIQKRKDYIDNNIKTAEEREKKSQNIVSEAEAIKSDSKKVAIETVKKAQDDALKEKETILESAKEEAKQIKITAQKEIEQEIEASKDEIHSNIVDVALDASKKILDREINEDDNRKLVEDFVSDIRKDN